MNKIAIIGCGNVGMAYAYSIILNNVNVDEIVLIDIDKNKAEGEAMDLSHCAVFRQNKCKIVAGDYLDCIDAQIVMISAGRNQRLGETRTDLIHSNIVIFKDIISKLKDVDFNGIYLIATNPLDVMTYFTLKISNTKPNKVIGSGTTLDTARLKNILSTITSINTDNIHAYVIGEHGDSEMIPWQSASIGLNSIDNYINQAKKDEILHDVRRSAYEIIKRKGNTSYGIGVCLTKITEAILNDDNTIMTVSSYDSSRDMYYGYPTIINKNGAQKQISLNLTPEELEELEKSINKIKDDMNSVAL